MKKTLTAVAVAAFLAGSAQATVVYDNEKGTKIDIDGRISLQVAKFSRDDKSDKRVDLYDKGSRVRVRGFQDIGGGFTALAAAEIRFTKNPNDFGGDIHTKRLFGGITHKEIGTFTFGRQLILGDDIGLSDYTYELGAIVKVVDAHSKALHFKSAKFNGFSFGADYFFGDQDKLNGDGSKHTDAGSGFNLAAFYETKFGDIGFKAEGGYGEFKMKEAKTTTTTVNCSNGDGTITLADGTVIGNLPSTATCSRNEKTVTETGSYKQKRYGAAVELSYDAFALGFDYAGAKSPKGHVDHTFRVGKAKYEKLDQFEIGLKYQFTEANKVYAEYLWGTGKTDGDDNGKFRGWFLGADHKFNKNFLVYVEGGSFNTKESGETVDKEKRIALGTRIYF